MKIVVAIQARMGSKRLSDKMLIKINGQTILDHVIERALRAKEIDQVVLATTDLPKDDVLELIAKKWGIGCFRGSESDVLGRLYQTAVAFDADALLRITGDSPLTDPALMDKMAREYRKLNGKIVFLSTCLPPTFPEGFSKEIVARSVLVELDKNLKEAADRETFMIHISRQPEKYPRYVLKSDKDYSHIRLTLDYPEDLELIQKIFEHFAGLDKKYFGLVDVMSFLNDRPELIKINQFRLDKEKYPYALGEAAVKKAI